MLKNQRYTLQKYWKKGDANGKEIHNIPAFVDTLSLYAVIRVDTLWYQAYIFLRNIIKKFKRLNDSTGILLAKSKYSVTQILRHLSS